MDTLKTPARRLLLVLAVVSSAVTAILYLLVGFEVLNIGEPARGVTRGVLGFGLLVAGAYALVTFWLLRSQRRRTWIAIGLLNAVVIGTYFVSRDARVPPFEWPGLAIQAVQLVMLVAVTVLAIVGRGSVPDPSTPEPGGVAERLR
jgi:peptidoglycan/LPS O-acetylase OafA/YrhL